FRARFVDAIKPVEHMRQILGRDAEAGVEHGKNSHASLHPCADIDCPVFNSVLNRIGKQIEDDLANALDIAADTHGCEVNMNLNVPVGGQRLDEFYALTGRRREIETLAPHGFLTGVKTGEFK